MVEDQAGDCLNDGGQDAGYNGAGNVRAAKLRSEGNEIQMWTDLLGQAWYVKTTTVQQKVTEVPWTIAVEENKNLSRQ